MLSLKILIHILLFFKTPSPSIAQHPQSLCLKKLIKLPNKFKTYLDDVTGEQVSKTELKKTKQRAIEAKKAAKAAATPAKTTTKKKDELADLNPNQFFEIRSRQISELREKNNADPSAFNPYPHKFNVTTKIPEFVENTPICKEETLKDVTVSVSGRIMTKRESGSKLKFYVLKGDGVEVQIMAQAQDAPSVEAFESMHEILRRGDIIGVTGYPGKTAPAKGGEGELSVFATKVHY